MDRREGDTQVRAEIDRAGFLKAWQTVERSASAKSVGGAMSGVLIAAGDETVLEATDLKTSIRARASGVRIIEPGRAVLPVRLVGDMLKKGGTDQVVLEVDGERGTLTSGRNRTRFVAPPVEEFPALPESGGANALCAVSAGDLMRTIVEGSTASAAPTDFPKYLGACLFRVAGGQLKVVSTDSKRLSLSQCPCDAEAEADLLLPIGPLRELVRLLSGVDRDVRVDVSDDGATAWYRMDGLELSIRRVESSFPNYERILTPNATTAAAADRGELTSALERIAVIANTTIAKLVVFHLSPGGALKLTARAPDMGTGMEVVDAEVDGDPTEIGFNVNYVLDGLRALRGGEAYIEFNGPEGQSRIGQRGVEDFLYMLMPARISPQDLMEDDGDVAPSADDADDEDDEGLS